MRCSRMRRRASATISKFPKSSNKKVMASELNKLTISEASAMLRKREITALELTRACLDRIAAADPKLNAFITVCEKEALEQARQPDGRLTAGDAPALCWIPLGIQDI